MNDDADFSPTTLLQGTPDGQAARARRPNHKLTEAQKDYVIRRLAAYDTPTEIQRDLREKFGVEITRQAVAGLLRGEGTDARFACWDSHQRQRAELGQAALS